MDTLRLLLTVVWAALVAGLSGFVLWALWLPRLQVGFVHAPEAYLPLGFTLATLFIAIGAMVRPVILWGLVAINFAWIVVRLVQLGAVGMDWPQDLHGALILLAPSYLLARWHSAASRQVHSNPADEF